jgi:hypothetical protein
MLKGSIIRLIVCLFKNLFYYTVRDDKSSLSNMTYQIKKVIINFVRQFSIVTIIFLLVCTDYIYDRLLMAVHIIAYYYRGLKTVSYFDHKYVESIVGLHK